MLKSLVSYRYPYLNKYPASKQFDSWTGEENDVDLNINHYIKYDEILKINKEFI